MVKVKKTCAIYTRKSSEEGLEQDFNSLDAQREACEAYVVSQKSEGWNVSPNQYNDGGVSGGTLERPALKQLMEDIRAGKVDIVVVYKIDRLTRSLMDFSKLVELFDEFGVTFVSVTQSFNTTTSMGRLTLNVLLSFAQFEREVTGERIRDKIAASKKKGMWMGGVPPIGYIPDGRQLVIDQDQAKLIQLIFEKYLEYNCVRSLKRYLDSEGITSPTRISQKGKKQGGYKFSRGKLYALLKNPIYTGKIKHRDQLHDGLHDPIIKDDLWQQVQSTLNDNRVKRSDTTKQRHILQGLLFDPDNVPYSPTFTKRAGKQYRYYISQNLLQDRDHPNGLVARIAAHEIENIVWGASISQIKKWLSDDVPTANYIIEYMTSDKSKWMRNIIQKITVSRQDLTIKFQPKIFAAEIEKRLNISLFLTGDSERIVPYQTRTARSGAKIIEPDGHKKDPLDLPADQLKRLAQGIIWRDRHFAGEKLKDIAIVEEYSESYIRHTIMKSFDTLMTL